MLLKNPIEIHLESIQTSWYVNMKYWEFNGYYFLIWTSSIFVFKNLNSLKQYSQTFDIIPYETLAISTHKDINNQWNQTSFFFDENSTTYFLKAEFEWECMKIYETTENIYTHKKEPIK